MSAKSSERPCIPCIDTEITATRDTIIPGSVKIIAMDEARPTPDILLALQSKRDSLKSLKTEYTDQIKKDGGFQKPSSRRQMIFQEIMSTYGALQGIKEELTRRGEPFMTDVSDHEHPNAAYRRVTAVKPKPEITVSQFVISVYLVFSTIALFLWYFIQSE